MEKGSDDVDDMFVDNMSMHVGVPWYVFVHSSITIRNQGAGVSSSRLEVAIGKLGISAMEVIIFSTDSIA